MLTKALLTGGMLSLLAGSIVYFGTEGAVATERADETRAETESMELAGGETDRAEAEQADPPKTRWLDQYLKSNSSKKEKEEDMSDEAEMDMENDKAAPEPEMDQMTEKKPGSRTREETLRIMKDAAKRPISDPRLMERAQKDGPGSGFLPQEMDMDDAEMRALPLKTVDYDRVIREAKKLQVVDMRDQAMLEIIDFAIDRGDMGEAADLVEDLSSPELRDTARSRIGKGLAMRGNADAAFAVLDEVEIDELAAPIRLEIIAALMATRAERRGQ